MDCIQCIALFLIIYFDFNSLDWSVGYFLDKYIHSKDIENEERLRLLVNKTIWRIRREPVIIYFIKFNENIGERNDRIHQGESA